MAGFDTRDNRAGAMGDLIMPMHPYPDGEELTQSDRQMVTGIYPGILAGVPIYPAILRGILSNTPLLEGELTCV